MKADEENHTDSTELMPPIVISNFGVKQWRKTGFYTAWLFTISGIVAVLLTLTVFFLAQSGITVEASVPICRFKGEDIYTGVIDDGSFCMPTPGKNFYCCRNTDTIDNNKFFPFQIATFPVFALAIMFVLLPISLFLFKEWFHHVYTDWREEERDDDDY